MVPFLFNQSPKNITPFVSFYVSPFDRIQSLKISDDFVKFTKL